MSLKPHRSDFSCRSERNVPFHFFIPVYITRCSALKVRQAAFIISLRINLLGHKSWIYYDRGDGRLIANTAGISIFVEQNLNFPKLFFPPCFLCLIWSQMDCSVILACDHSAFSLSLSLSGVWWVHCSSDLFLIFSSASLSFPWLSPTIDSSSYHLVCCHDIPTSLFLSDPAGFSDEPHRLRGRVLLMSSFPGGPGRVSRTFLL